MNVRGNQLKSLIGLLIILVCAISSTPARASGVLMYETGTPGVGMGSAGYAAGAQDASTLYYNPAGMMRLGKSEYITGVQALVGYTKFQPGPNMTTTGSDGFNSIGWLPAASYYYVDSVNSRTKVGFGTFSNFGIVVPEGSGGRARYSFDGGILIGITFMPAVAYRMSDKWSVGAALNATLGILRAQAAIDNSLESRADGKVEMSDNTWGFGGNLGLMYEADKKTRVGLTYNSPVSMDFSSTPSYTNLGPVLEQRLRDSGWLDRKINRKTTIPQQLMLGFAHELNSRWTLMGDVGWQNWGNFSYKQVSVDSANASTITRELHGRDTWHAALGAQYKASPKWTLSFGVGYDTSAFNDSNRPLAMPVGAAWRFGVGASTALDSNSKLNFGYEALISGTLGIDQQGEGVNRIDGTYMQGMLHFFTVNYQRKF